ncbi:hypothetical protein MASR1M12_07130 [Erysipelotrichia bacterium]|jgi:hypothetical protein
MNGQIIWFGGGNLTSNDVEQIYTAEALKSKFPAGMCDSEMQDDR